ncbi:MAG: hypothetical protein ACPG5P_05670, partial [Saprospiraceae bacterium]
DLEEMKSLWGDMSNKLEQQELLNDKIILEMTELKYKNKINKLFNLELMPNVFNTVVAVFILINFYKLDTLFLQMSGGVLIILFLSSFFSLWKIQQMKNLDVTNHFEKTLTSYVKLRKELHFFYKLSYPLGFVVFILFCPVYTKIFFGKALEMTPLLWLVFSIIIIIVLTTTSLVVSKSYGKLTDSAENILKELDE